MSTFSSGRALLAPSPPLSRAPTICDVCVVCVVWYTSEGITVSKQSQVMAQVTYQALFRSFPKLCGMTGTAATDASELAGTYDLQVVEVRVRVLL